MAHKGRFLIVVSMLTWIISFAHAETLSSTDGLVTATIPQGWTTVPSDGAAVIQGRATDPVQAPRIALTLPGTPPAEAAAAIRAGVLKVGDGTEIIDEDDLPIGGRVWRRIRYRFATGPLVFGQSAWIGQVGGHTVSVVLSAPDDRLAAQIDAATGLIASLAPAR